ncbi:unnamed protein product [Lepeophtheirus salmonis]|uniref:(salmon louse) hypothetical protein n=1 Tax=Lepeophtheirus salmonis TaxID=72036 RepID=A0A7R8H0W3_LEPSM|nr:unnamed protein product [Lepeophtheirus salmonis]CAF2776751.1 unnamed protein product [Lepeophtheirus salmonis]
MKESIVSSYSQIQSPQELHMDEVVTKPILRLILSFKALLIVIENCVMKYLTVSVKYSLKLPARPLFQSPADILNSPEVVILPDIPSATDSTVQLEPTVSSDVPQSVVRPSIVRRLPTSPSKHFGTNVYSHPVFLLEPLSTPPTLTRVP